MVHKKNGGLSDAGNAGFQASHGAYIGFIGGDDYVDEKMYEILCQMKKKLRRIRLIALRSGKESLIRAAMASLRGLNRAVKQEG